MSVEQCTTLAQEWIKFRARALELRLEHFGIHVEAVEPSGPFSKGNPARPEAPRELEADFFVAIKRQISARLVRQLQRAFGKDVRTYEARAWGKARTFAQVSLSEDVTSVGSVEIDIHITSAPFIPASRYWNELFSVEEISWQRTIRRLVKSQCSSEAYIEVKMLQSLEAGWRLCAALSLSDESMRSLVSAYYSDEIPLREVSCTGFEAAISAWLAGEFGGMGLDRPVSLLPNEFVNSSYSSSVELPTPPAWVVAAERLQHYYAHAAPKFLVAKKF